MVASGQIYTLCSILGIGLAMIAAAKGYQAVITMPEKMSAEKSNTLNALGAQIYRTPTEVPSDHPDSNICKQENHVHVIILFACTTHCLHILTGL